MTGIRRVASVATITVAVAAASIAAMPAAQAGLEAPAEAPAAYAIGGGGVLAPACQLVTVDLSNGAVGTLGAPSSVEACAHDLAVAPDGSVWGIAEPSGAPPALLVHFDPATGEVLSSTAITGDFPDASIAEGGLAFDAAGTLFAQLSTDACVGVCLYTLDRDTAVATLVGGPGDDLLSSFMYYLGADCAGSMVTTEVSKGSNGDAASAESDPTAQVFGPTLASVDPATGLVTTGSAFQDDFDLAGLDYARADGTLYALGRVGPTPTGSTDDTTAATGDVGAAAFDASLFVVDPETAGITEVTALSEPNLDISALGIAGECPVPPPPAPVVLAPTFTG